MDQGGSCIVPIVKVPKMKEQVHLKEIKPKKNLKKKEVTFRTTIESLKEDNGANVSLPTCPSNVLKK